MSDKYKLMELLTRELRAGAYFNRPRIAGFADYLIANGVVIQKQGEWILVDKKKGTGVCSNCHRLEHIDPLGSYCRYCGAKMREVK